jgi:hypothetical protein
MKSLLSVFTAFCVAIALNGCAESTTSTPSAAPSTTEHTHHGESSAPHAEAAPAGETAPAAEAPAAAPASEAAAPAAEAPAEAPANP